MIKGIRGKNTRVRNIDSSAIVSLEIDQNSISNSVLNQVVSKDRELGTGRLSISITDPYGAEKFYSDSAFLEGLPSYSLEAESGDRQWNVHCSETSGRWKLR